MATGAHQSVGGQESLKKFIPYYNVVLNYGKRWQETSTGKKPMKIGQLHVASGAVAVAAEGIIWVMFMENTVGWTQVEASYKQHLFQSSP